MKEGFFTTLLYESRVIARYVRRKFFPTHGKNEPLRATKTFSAPKPEPIKPAPTVVSEPSPAPTPEPQPVSTEQMAEKLMSKFGEKLNEREKRKRQAISQISRRGKNEQKAEDDRQMTFDFEETPVEAPPEPTPPPTINDLDSSEYHLPDISIFKTSEGPSNYSEDEIHDVAKKIQDCIDNFNVDAEVNGAIRGPRITMHKIDVAQGVRVSIISSYERDLAMALSAESLRIIAPVPGHDYVGIEVPNIISDSVLVGDIIHGRQWSETKALLPLTLGKNIEGQDVILDLARAPHLIVAGATGSGKSVCLNTFIVSLITRFAPSELRLLLVDPKQVEMNMYNTLPHLITPVINDAPNVVLALKWLVYEMTTRYRLLSKAGVRNLEDFNNRPKDETPILDDEGNPIPQKMPFIVLIIDELADIMLTSRQDVENSLARLAQMSRAVGIHTIIATQRPSVDVLTGVIKANFPTRIAFKTSSQVDSRTILDGKGAESLLGKGDMLFKPPTASGLQRIQGAMITDDEIRELVNFCAAQQDAPDSFDIIRTASQNEAAESSAEVDTGDGDDESLIRAATEIIFRDQKPSISYIQRRLKIGYNKAASIMEILEKRGVVGPQVGTMKREILISEDEL